MKQRKDREGVGLSVARAGRNQIGNATLRRPKRRRRVKLTGLSRRYTSRFRRARMQGFAQRFGLTEETRILDMGGTPWNWSFLPPRNPVVIVNISVRHWPRRAGDKWFRWVIADARRLPFRDGAFDVAFSNSVIEHVGTLNQQAEFASECQRVARRYFVQTPNRRFFLEPHLLTPFVHWLPRRWMARLLPFTVWRLLARPEAGWGQKFMRDVWLLDERQIRQLFPDGKIRFERFLGMKKAIVVEGPLREQGVSGGPSVREGIA